MNKKIFLSIIFLTFSMPAYAKEFHFPTLEINGSAHKIKEYGGMKADQAKRFKQIEQENARLKRLLAEAELDKAILREAAQGNF